MNYNDFFNSKTDPFIKSEFNPFWMNVFYYVFLNMAKKSFYSMRIKNAINFEKRDKSRSSIFFATHCSWWDGPIAYLLCRGVLKTNMRMMIHELYRFPLLSKIGAFSVEKDSPQASVKSLNYCVKFLQDPQSSLWIFPQGFVMPPDYRPLTFASGLSYLCKKVEKVNLIPIAHRYNFLREDRPEILIEVGKPILIESNSLTKKEITAYLEDNFTNFLDNQRWDVSLGNLENYEFFFKSRLCMAKIIENHFTSFVRSFNI